MFEKKQIFKKTKERILNDFISKESESCYNRLIEINDIDQKFFFISMISEISGSLIDFYLDINRTSNIFYNNISGLDEKLIKVLYTYDAIFLFLNYMENNKNMKSYDNIEKRLFYIFKFTSKDKKFFKNAQKTFKSTKVSFNLTFVSLFCKKVFTTKVQNAMEFAYISYYLDSTYMSFYESYKNSVLEVI